MRLIHLLTLTTMVATALNACGTTVPGVGTAVPEVDTTPPQTTIDSGPTGTTNSTGATFTFSCDEGTCTYECQLDSGGWSSCTSPKAYDSLVDATHTFEVRAYDAALNVDASPASATWTVDTSGGGATGFHWVSIPGGSFDMGDASDPDGVAPNTGDGEDDELPVHTVTLSAFDMYAYEVTNGEYQACVSAGSCTAPGATGSHSGRSPYYGNAAYANYPVIYVDWQQSVDFCTWIGGRLPTEAEWEYAARGGLAGKRFPWGDTIDCNQANYYTTDSSAYEVDPYVGEKFCATPGDTTIVGDYAANGYGLYDMAGNVWEWVSDWHSSTYYSSSLLNDPQGPASGILRMLRGGLFSSNANNARAASRFSTFPTLQHDLIGFRCAR